MGKFGLAVIQGVALTLSRGSRARGSSGLGTAPCPANSGRGVPLDFGGRQIFICLGGRMAVCHLEMARCLLFPRVSLCVAVRGPGLHLQSPLSAQDASEVKALMGTLWLLVTTTTIVIILQVGRMRGT